MNQAATKPPRYLVTDIVRAVAEEWQIAPSAIVGPRRFAWLREPRHAVLWIARIHCRRSIRIVSQSIGREPWGVCAATNLAKTRHASDQVFRKRVACVLERLASKDLRPRVDLEGDYPVIYQRRFVRPANQIHETITGGRQP